MAKDQNFFKLSYDQNTEEAELQQFGKSKQLHRKQRYNMLKHRKVCKLQGTLPNLPTEKQIEFAKEIQETLGLEKGPYTPGTLPETREAYSKYISKYIDLYSVQTADNWIFDHGYF